MKLAEKSDFLLIAGVLILCIAAYLLLSRHSGSMLKKAEIYYGDKVVRAVSLNAGTGETIVSPYNPDVIIERSEDGRVRFLSSDCPDKVCVKTGWISLPGSCAVCLPNRTLIKITAGETENDIIVG